MTRRTASRLRSDRVDTDGMCGILGIVASVGRDPSVTQADAVRMRDVMTERGPDDAGMLVRDNVILGHRRLAIRDRFGGQQPWVSDDGSLALVYNGELYNDAELRAELERHGATFRSQCDTETLIAAWKTWGVSCLERLNGMFAFGVYDFERQQLFLVRDRFGVKPLFYASTAGEFVFASSVAAMLRHPSIGREPDWRSVSHYLTTFRQTLGSSTLYRDIRQLRPAECLTWDLRRDRVHIDRYWEFPESTGDAQTFESAAERFEELLSDSTERRLVSDVPVGLFLSGGVDSNMLASLVRERHQGQMLACCGGGDVAQSAEKTSDEDDFHFARAHADQLGLEFDQVRLSAEDYLESWQAMVDATALPLCTPSDVIIHGLATRMRPEVGVVIGGEGADELLCGYTLPHWGIEDYRLSALAASGNWPGSAVTERVFLHGLQQRYGRAEFAGPLDHYFAANSNVPGSVKSALLNAPVLQAIDGDASMFASYASEFEHAGDCGDGSDSWLRRAAIVLHRVNLESLLSRLDTATMLASLEARVPYTDYRLVEFAFTLPTAFRIDVNPNEPNPLLPAVELDRRGSLRSKRLLRHIASRRMPERAAQRRKASFPTPVANWLSGPWERWASDRLKTSPFGREVFRQSTLNEMANNVGAVGMWLWPVLNLLSWGDRVL